MKKTLLRILTIVLCVVLCSCGSSAEKNAVSEPGTETVLQESANMETVSEESYTNSRSEQVQSIIDRLNNGGDQTPSIEEIMALPEIAEAEHANDGTETIDLPNREKIREEGYQKAILKGSWNGEDYSGEVLQNRRMDIVIGLPGSGKSSVYTERLSQEHKSRVIDTDDFREYIPEYNGSNASLVHREASALRDLVFDTALDNGDNILLSTIGADAEKLEKQITAYKEEGYQIYLHLNELPNNKSLARAISRYIGEDGTAAPANLLAGYDWYNNDVEKGEPPRLIQTSEESASSNIQ